MKPQTRSIKTIDEAINEIKRIQRITFKDAEAERMDGDLEGHKKSMSRYQAYKNCLYVLGELKNNTGG